jgi:hypothetical protein
MTYPRCPQIDILSNQLIEAYRKMDDTEISAIWGLGDNGVFATVASLHLAMREHKQACVLCNRVMHDKPVSLVPDNHIA